MVKVMIGVLIETGNGSWLRISGPFIDDTHNGLYAPGGYITYPDSRVKTFKVWVSLHDGSDFQVYKEKEFPASKSEKANLAYAQFKVGGDTLAYADFPASPTYDKNGEAIRALETSTVEHDPNTVLVSTPYMTRELLGRHAHYIGNDADDTVVAFHSPSKEVSSGQFGQYPLYALCKRSAWALEVGEGDNAFLRVIPLSVGRGAVGAQAVESVDRSIMFAARDGVFILGAAENSIPVSFPLHGPHGETFTLDENVAMHYFMDAETGRRELWVATNERIYCYSLDYARWFTIEGVRRQFALLYGRTLSLGSDGKIYRETGSTYRTGKVKIVPLTLGQPDVLKRFRRLIERIGSLDQVFVWEVTDYELSYARDSINAEFIELAAEAELRYEHRPRIHSNLRG